MFHFQVDRWPHNDYIKKLKRKDGCFNYFNKQRECPDKDINKCKIYVYQTTLYNGSERSTILMYHSIKKQTEKL